MSIDLPVVEYAQPAPCGGRQATDGDRADSTERRDRAIGDAYTAMAAVAHELRTPMQGLIGMLDMLAESALTDAQRQMVDLSLKSANALQHIADDALAFARCGLLQGDVEADAHAGLQVNPHVNASNAIRRVASAPLTPGPVDVRQLVGDLAIALQAQARHRPVEIVTCIDPELVMHVMTDAQRLRQILLNLTQNALKFTRQGCVAVHVTASDVADRPPLQSMQCVCIAVADDGIGIDPEDLDVIWRPLSAASETTRLEYGGSGLGLMIARTLTEQLGGTLQLSSRPGEGTVVTLQAQWPIADAPLADRTDDSARAAKGASPPPGSASAAMPAYVLVVDDHPTTRIVLATQLRHLGCVVDTAHDGEHALTKLRRRRYDLMLTDCRMPGTDGFALTAAWRAIEQAGALPMKIIGLSALPQGPESRQGVLAGMDACHSKPLTLPTLREVCASTRQTAGLVSMLGKPSSIQRDVTHTAPFDLACLRTTFGGDDMLKPILGSFSVTTLADLDTLAAQWRALEQFTQAGPADSLERHPVCDRTLAGHWDVCQRHLHRITGGLQILGNQTVAARCGRLEQQLADRRARMADRRHIRRYRAALRVCCVEVAFCVDWLARST